MAQSGKSKPPPKQRSVEEDMVLDRRLMKPPSGAGFYIAPMHDLPGQFSLVLADADNRTVADAFRADQIIIFEAILSEAKRFAQTDEAVGKRKPITTRFYDKREPAFMVDVAKLGSRSQFFVTVTCLTGQLTMDAGSLRRGDEKASPLFYDILKRVQEARAATQPPG
ncbi:MAG TPA: hypothetical protein VJH03_26805 [Blastocatellia bacterium]|nr:hypothetical protein [Blastocatellia bacterium]